MPTAPVPIRSDAARGDPAARPHGTVATGAVPSVSPPEVYAPRAHGMNVAHECVDRHAAAWPDRVALAAVHGRSRTSVTYGELRGRTDRTAVALGSLGVRRGDLVAVVLGAGVDLVVVLLGAAKLGAVACPLAPGAGAAAVAARLDRLGARVLVTTAGRAARLRSAGSVGLPGSLEHVVVVGDEAPAGTVALGALERAAAGEAPVALATAYDEPAFVHFSGSPGAEPHPVVTPHGMVGTLCATAALALDLHAGDVSWCTAEPGSAMLTAYGIVAPLATGATALLDDGGLDAERWYDVVRDEGVTVWYTTAAALRTLRRAGAGLAREHRVRALRVLASTGEPVDAATAAWGVEAFGLPVRDTWWQTEVGAIAVAQPVDGVRTGALGVPLPGVVAAVARCGPDGRAVHGPDGGIAAVATGTTGELVLRTPWPMRSGRDGGGWQHTGDLVHRDEEGWLWFDGRSDEAVVADGRCVGAFALERALLAHPAVAEAAVVPVDGGAAAFVVLHRGQGASARLRDEILVEARRRLAGTCPLASVTIVGHLPRTASGRLARGFLPRDR